MTEAEGSGASVALIRPQLAATRQALEGPVKLAARKPLGFLGLSILIIVGTVVAVSPLLPLHPYDLTDFRNRLQGPSWEHPFGTDHLGRDLLSRTIVAARVSLSIGVAAVLIAKAGATFLALVSAYYRRLDEVLQRVVDVWLALPTLVLLVTFLGILGPSAKILTVVIGLLYVPVDVRLFRSVLFQLLSEPYVDAARAIGASDLRLMLRHVLPNMMPILIYSMSLGLGSSFLLLAAAGFLGFGVPPPQSDLGSMLSGEAVQYLRRSPWLSLWPGLWISAIVFASNVLGDAVRDLLDPRLRGR